MTKEKEVLQGAPSARKPRMTLDRAIRAIDLFINYGMSIEDSTKYSYPPEAGLHFDGETWSNRRNESG